MNDSFSLRTDRVTIRQWRTDEAEVLLGIRRRPEVTQWLSDPEPWADVDQARDAIALWRSQAMWAIPSSCAIVPHHAPEPVGSVSLHRMPVPGAGDVPLADADWLGEFGVVDGAPREVEIGWYLHPDEVGKGWASEAAAAMLTHGLSSGVDRIWAMMWSHNAPSAAVCHRIGMQELGVRVDPWYGSAQDATSRIFIAHAPAAT